MAEEKTLRSKNARPIPSEIYLIALFAVTGVIGWIARSQIWWAINVVNQKIGPVIYAYLLIGTGFGIMVALWMQGRWIGAQAFGHRRTYHRYRRYVAESLDALEYLSRVGTNVSAMTLAAVKAVAGDATHSREDHKSLAELLVGYKNIFQKPPAERPAMDEASKGNLIIIHNYLSFKVGEH